MRIAMWSGPRNLSTAMMYAFGNRSDFAIWDEPFYAPYLAATDKNHPMRAEIMKAHETDPTIVAAQCIDTIPAQKPHFYMKHMPHHMLVGFPIDWAENCVNVHLIRHPARVIASYGAKRGEMAAADLGFQQQAAMYERLGGIVVDSADIRRDPKAALAKLCDAIGLRFDPAMLAWPAGPRDDDGIWARHWYNAVHKSTGFAGAEGPMPELDARGVELLNETLPHYARMKAEAID